MLASIDSAFYTLFFCAVIIATFAGAWRYLGRERSRLAALNSYIVMKYRLGVKVTLDAVPRDIADEITRVEGADVPAEIPAGQSSRAPGELDVLPDRRQMRRQTSFDALWKRAARLESSVDFWVDLLQKLGLLGTVLGLGMTLAIDTDSVTDLLGPLGTAVWTTIVGLLCAIAISWRFGRDMDVEVDAHEEHLEEWQAALGQGQPAPAGPISGPAAGPVPEHLLEDAGSPR